MSVEVKRTRGRPLGAVNGIRKNSLYQPKKWKPIHETIVTLHVLGQNNLSIAKNLKLSNITVGNTINSDYGQERIKELQTIHNKHILETEQGKISEIREASIGHIHKVLTDPEINKGRPLLAFENSLKALNALKNVSPTEAAMDNRHPNSGSPLLGSIQNNIAVFATPEFAERIIAGLTRVEQIANKKNGVSP